MRKSPKSDILHNLPRTTVEMDFHRFLEKEDELNNFELANEFGVSLREVHQLKKRLQR